MKAVHDKIEGPFAIEEDLALYGMVIGSATLRSGIKLILHGTIAGDLILEPGARAIIHGTVAGRICNEGGRAENVGLVDLRQPVRVHRPGVGVVEVSRRADRHVAGRGRHGPHVELLRSRLRHLPGREARRATGEVAEDVADVMKKWAKK